VTAAELAADEEDRAAEARAPCLPLDGQSLALPDMLTRACAILALACELRRKHALTATEGRPKCCRVRQRPRKCHTAKRWHCTI